MQQHHHEQSAQLDRHYHEAVNPHESNKAVNVLLFICMLVLLALVSWGAYNDQEALKRTAILLAYGTLILFVLIAVSYVIYLICHKLFMDKQQRRHAVLDVQAKENQVEREHRRLHPDQLGNYPAIWHPVTNELVTVPSGNYMQPVPHTIHIDGSDHSTRSAPEQNLLAAAASLHIPTFAESLASGDIGPGQRDMLFCHEVVVDEVTHQAHIAPIRGEIGVQHTQFIVAGSQSGKTTYMSDMVAQSAFLKTLFYIVDPHKMHPEKSISAKVAAFKDFFILPPASTHDEIKRLLAHATRTRDDLIQQKPTPYQGYHIMVIVDEVPALMAWQRSPDKNLKQLYVALALFMQSIGTQTAKFGMTGLFSSQFATKDQLGDIDIRDACMSQFIMRLHPTQAQAMRILGPEVVREIPKLEKGHGYLMLSDSTEARRVAAGNVTMSDLTAAAALLPPSPLVTIARPATTIVPIRGDVVVEETSASQVDNRQINNQIDSALQAKLDEMGIPLSYITLKVDRVTELLGRNKADIIKAVWNRSPGKNKEYYQAEAEFQICMEIIRNRAKKEA